ncbi:hypothetical protein [Meiothermus sp. CFH 77666]|uniref:hypothetical protein n=1 Tax=Meiothermus sp. CFH 77666 TaxID=2817942 RepID=UPI001AA04CE2|nr:hypothetical protein [Meiothermus sp. CFH 77666]MBO1438326.1 hypothetical protein [Meiothermus sp. CFH 77666]
MKKMLATTLFLLGIATAQGYTLCEKFEVTLSSIPIVKAHPYPGRVLIEPSNNTYRIGVPWQRVPGYAVERLEIIPTRGRDVGQPFAYTNQIWCYDPQVKFAEYDGKLFWITIPRWMLNGGCYEALIYRFGPGRESLERRQYSFCFNP